MTSEFDEMEEKIELHAGFDAEKQADLLTWGVITGCSLSGLRARKLFGKKIFLANALFGIVGFSELANSLGK